VSPGLTTTFRSLKVRNYRLFASGQVISLSGTWAQRVAQDWLVLELSHNSGVALGITTGLQFLPVLLFGLYGGVLADRYDKRALLIGAQVAMGVFALALGLLDLTGAVQLWHVYALAFLLGLASVIDTPVRQAFVVEMVGPADLPNAVSLNSATFNASRILGPAVAGVAINSVGTAPVFLANAASYIAVLIGLVAIRRTELFDARRVARAKGQLREGLSYVRSNPQLYVPIALIAVIGTFGLNFQITLALIAKQTFHMGAGSYGALSAMLATGSLLGALASARRSTGPSNRVLYGSALAFGICEVLTGLAPSYTVMAVLLVPTGMAVLTFTTMANTTVQLTSAPHMRGRVMSIYVLVFLGGTPLGAPVIGAVAEVLGPRSSLLIGGVVSAAAAIAAALYLRRLTASLEPAREQPHDATSAVVGRTTAPMSPTRRRSPRPSRVAQRTARR
jgi:MFS family permease